MPSTAAEQSYTRKQALRLLGVTERQMVSWEKQKLVAPAETYGFRELVAVRSLIKLRKNRVAPLQIRRALIALRGKLRHIEDPLAQLALYSDGKKIRVEIDGGAMDAESGQLLLDFDRKELKRLREFPVKDKGAAEREQRHKAEHWFQRGLELEGAGGAAEDVIAAYEKAVELDPKSAGALVNLGTIHFNARRWAAAERYYERALEADPDYALAHFDLANLYDERGDRGKAAIHYEAAIKASPNYADAHYNLALLFQGSQQPMKAVQHWSKYLKLDPSSHWAAVARRELAKLREATVLPGARNRTPGR